MEIRLPQKVKTIIDTLCANGYEAYAVGGCVRDSILGRVPGDWDITTSAQPEETKKLFKRTFDTGIEHGTVTVLIDGEGFEVTTYRIDGKYEDSRHPSEVQFTRNLEEDLKRRDFTINAMAYNDAVGIVDIFGGMEDLCGKVIRCVGEAKERFGEDALRILRAVRFAAQLGFEIEEKTKEGIRELSPTLANISAERIQVELVKMLTSENPGMIQTAYELGITKVILPEFDQMMKTEQETPHHMYNVGEHTVKSIEKVRADKVLRFTMLLHDVAKPLTKTLDYEGRAHFKGHELEGEKMAKAILRRLKFDNDTLRKVTKLVYFHDDRMPAEMKYVRRAMCKMGEELFPLYLEVHLADTLAQSDYKREEKLANIQEIQKCYEEIVKQNQCVSLRNLAVTGSDLLAIGMKPGKEIGIMLNHLLEMVIEDPELNKKEVLEERVKEILYS
ncbi:CCA tRNA nucleotidyltransferase [Lachnospiraceae bacterium EP-SM-12S-S03]|nr:CCA tRNA nucleotidyltransferase [Lachnospiraceae bacterium EP-SM-12S-S03]